MSPLRSHHQQRSGPVVIFGEAAVFDFDGGESAGDGFVQGDAAVISISVAQAFFHVRGGGFQR